MIENCIEATQVTNEIDYLEKYKTKIDSLKKVNKDS